MKQKWCPLRLKRVLFNESANIYNMQISFMSKFQTNEWPTMHKMNGFLRRNHWVGQNFVITVGTSICWSVRPSVGPSVGNQLFSHSENEVLS